MRPSKEVRNLMKKVRTAAEQLNLNTDVEVHLAFSCPVSWESMSLLGDGIRHCSTCESPVFDLLGASKKEVTALLRKHKGKVCGQVMAREDGKVVFGACQESTRLARGGLLSSG